MATIPASTSAGTIDVPTLVSQLMTVANQPLNKLNTQISNTQTKISDFGTISGLVSGLQTAVQGINTSLVANSATSSNTAALTASASSAAAAGNYAINVTALAQAQSLVSAGKASATTAISNGVATTVSFDFGTTTGATFTTNGAPVKSIVIDGTNNSLQGIASAINAANMGVTATIINDGTATTPNRITLTSNSTGATSSMKITTAGGDGTINALLGYDPAAAKNLTQTIAAQNANFTVNGIAVSSASNTVSTAIQGVTLTLGSVTATPTNLSVAHDTQGATNAINNFVSAYNALESQLKIRSAYGTATAPGTALAGNPTLRLMMTQLQGVFNTPTTPAAGGTLSYLAQAGVSFQTDGTLKVDSVALNNAMTTNFNDVTNLFSSATGVATRLNTWANSVLSAGNGLIPTATQNLSNSISSDTNQASQMQTRLNSLQAQYTQQYSNLNMLLSKMNSTSAYLASQFSKN